MAHTVHIHNGDAAVRTGVELGYIARMVRVQRLASSPRTDERQPTARGRRARSLRGSTVGAEVEPPAVRRGLIRHRLERIAGIDRRAGGAVLDPA